MFQNLKNIIFFLIAAGLVISLTNNIFQYHKRRQVFTLYENQLQQEQKQNKKLKMQVAQSRDYFTIEETIREKLNKTRPGEYVIIMPGSNQIDQNVSQHAKPTYRQWFELLIY